MWRLEFLRETGATQMELDLTQGKKALVDLRDAERAIQFGMWCASRDSQRRWYAVCPTRGPNGGWRNVYLHRFILDVSDSDVFIDHINHDGLDCRRSNMRLSTAAENSQNTRSPSGQTSSDFRGVSWDKDARKWRVRIQAEGRTHTIGWYESDVRDSVDWGEFRAAEAYDEAALKYHGRFAMLNLPSCCGYGRPDSQHSLEGIP